ncbi:HinT-interacting membrane complex protein P80 [Mycoplasma phocoeninasale]|uniref:HinT-interacting membrane complex protein P80 n=1 Tax=Mycoplasma phocoeninasale TaxID=2726117 RepID=UPI0019672630|nr:hypothetical protein [Mycoplasma phocoeninasale]MBN0970611.1 hypothetical protein [Mycoplasma phocoeninasale]
MLRKNKKIETTEQKIKRKRILWGTFWGTALSAIVATGIAVPLLQAQKSLPKPSPILQENSPILDIISPGNKNKIISWGDVDKIHERLNASKNVSDGVESNLTKYLYEKEYEGSLWYEAVYNADKAKSDEKTFALPSVDKVRQEETSKINDLEKKFQDQYGLEKLWREKFLEQIATKEYGESKTKEAAIEFKVVQRLNEHAFRRYKTEVNSDFSYSELKNGIIANKDVYYTYNGERKDIAKKGETITLPFAIENENYVLPKEGDVEIKTNPKDEVKIPMFVTRSFIKELKNPSHFIAPWIQKKQSIISTLSLTAHPDFKDAKNPWVVTKEEVIKLLKFSAYPQKDNKVKIALGVDLLGGFEGLSTLLKKENISADDELKAQNDKKLIEYVASDAKMADKYGSKGFEDITSHLRAADAKDYIPLLSMLLGDANDNKGIFKFKSENNLFKNLKDNLIKLFGNNTFTYNGQSKTFKNILEMQSVEKSKSDNYVAEFAAYNDAIAKFINDMEDKTFAREFGEAFRNSFGDANNGYKVSTIIKTSEDQYVLVGETGIQIQNLFKLDSEAVIKRLIRNDLAIKSKAKYSNTLVSELFNLSTIFDEILTKDYTVNDLLKQDEFKNYIKQQEYKTIDDKTKKFTDDDIEKALSYQKSLNETLKFALINDKANKIKDYVTKQINSNVYSDYKFDSQSGKFTLEPHSQKDILDYLFNTIVDFIKDI